MMNRKSSGTILVSALLIFAAFTIAVTDVLAATSPSLGSASSFAVLAYSKVANTGPTVVTGDVGLSPTTGAAITGFPPGAVIGTIYAVDAYYTPNPGLLTTAKLDLSNAYDALGSQGCDVTYPGAFKDLVGESLGPGVYCATEFRLSGTLTLSGSGVWIFWSTTTLITSGTANVVGGDPCNVWWRVDSSATLGTNTQLTGNILALTSITLTTGARLNGRALASNGAVTLDTNRVTASICVPITTVTTTVVTTIYTTTISNTETTITTLTTILTTITIFSPIAVAVGGEILPVDALQLFAPYFVAILIAAAAIGLVMYKRRTQ